MSNHTSIEQLKSLTTDELLSKKSDFLSDHRRNLNMEELKQRITFFIDEKCDLYQSDSVEVPCSQYSEKNSIIRFFFARQDGIYEIGLEHPFFTQRLQFARTGEEPIFFILKPKGQNQESQRMVFNSKDHANVAFDGIIEVFSTIKDIDERMDCYEDYEEGYMDYGY